MAIIYNDNVAVFDETVGVEEAEGLLEWLQKHPGGGADFSSCMHVHASGLQVLMAAGTPVVAWPHDEGLKNWLTSALAN